MTESGFEMPPDHIVSQMLSILDLSAPVIMTIPLLSQSGRGSNAVEHFDIVEQLPLSRQLLLALGPLSVAGAGGRRRT